MLRVVSLWRVLSVLPCGVTEYPCNPNPTRITKPTTGNNVLRLIFIVDLYSFDGYCLRKISILFVKLQKELPLYTTFQINLIA